MWLLPNNLPTLPFVPDMMESDSDSTEFSELAARSLLSRSKPLQPPAWLKKWKREPWLQHLSGRTLKPSLHGSFTDAWTSFLRDSRANPSPQQEKEGQTKTHDTSGLGSPKQSDLFDQGWLSLKTSQESFQPRSRGQDGTTTRELRYCFMSSENWKEEVTRLRGESTRRRKSAHLTGGSGSSSWPTPTARDEKGASGSGRQERKGNPSDTLANAMLNWATPNTMDYMGQRSEEALHRLLRERKGFQSRSHNLREQVQNGGLPVTFGQAAQVNYNTTGNRQGQPENWSTPTARDWKGAEGRAHKGYTLDLPAQTEGVAKAKVGKLNPDWVETLMGLPIGHTNYASGNRTDRLRLLGNGVVPQTAALAISSLLSTPPTQQPPKPPLL